MSNILPPRLKLWKHRRFIVAIMAFFGFFNAYTLRGNLSIAIVAMTSDRYGTLANETVVNLGPEFEWSNEIQGYILSSFFYGYITTQLLGGYFAKKYGGKIIFGTGIAITAAFTVVTPWLVGVSVLLAARIIEGFAEGVTYPSILAVWAQWAPPLERSRLAMLASSGSYFGTVITMPLSAYLAESLGWRSIFWFFGVTGVIWYGLWLLIVADSPAKDSKITEEERNYIETSLKHAQKTKEDMIIPWKSIIKSKAVWAICIANFCENWGFYTFLTQLPKYLKDIYSFNLSKSGFLTALPYLATGIMVPLSGQLADFCLSRQYLTVTQCRKIWNLLGFLAQFAFLMACAFVSNEVVTVLCLTLAVSIGAFAFAAYCVNPLDIAPQYASIILGISNTFGTMPGIISPILSGYIVSDNPTVEEWQKVFFIAAGLYLFGAFSFAILSSGKVQVWAQIPDKNITNLKNKNVC